MSKMPPQRIPSLHDGFYLIYINHLRYILMQN